MMSSEDGKVLSELGTEQESHTIRAVVSMEVCSLRGRLAAQAFGVTFEDNLCPISIQNAGSYIKCLVR